MVFCYFIVSLNPDTTCIVCFTSIFLIFWEQTSILCGGTQGGLKADWLHYEQGLTNISKFPIITVFLVFSDQVVEVARRREGS